jgi:hypothetical protein
MAVTGMLFGCNKDVSRFTPTPFADTDWVQQILPSSAVSLLADSLSLPPFVDSVQLAGADTVSLVDMQCILPDSGWVTAYGTSYTGGAQVSALLLNRPGEWIRQFASTVYQGTLIQTGALLYLSVSADGALLRPSLPIRVSFPTTATFPEADIYTGGYDQTLLQWTSLVSGNSLTMAQDTVYLATTQTGWLLCGGPLAASTRAPGTVVVTLPNGFSNANTAVFCLIPGSRALAYLRGDPNSRTFAASGLPAGTNATLFSLTLTGNTFYLGTRVITLSSGETTYNISPGLESLSDITSFLEHL